MTTQRGMKEQQLKQQIIHYKSEVSRYKKLLAQYQENYYYKLIDELKEENEQLRNRIAELEMKQDHEEEIEQKLRIIRDKSIEQLKAMKEENEHLKKQVVKMRGGIERRDVPLKIVEREAERMEQQSEWFMRTVRERDDGSER